MGVFFQSPACLFVSVSFSWLRPYNKNKLEFCSKPYVFLWYSLNHRGYRCYDLVLNEQTFFFQTIPSFICSSAPDSTTPMLLLWQQRCSTTPYFVLLPLLHLPSILGSIPLPNSLSTSIRQNRPAPPLFATQTQQQPIKNTAPSVDMCAATTSIQ